MPENFSFPERFLDLVDLAVDNHIAEDELRELEGYLEKSFGMRRYYAEMLAFCEGLEANIARERPELLALALTCSAHAEEPKAELAVVDQDRELARPRQQKLFALTRQKLWLMRARWAAGGVAFTGCFFLLLAVVKPLVPPWEPEPVKPGGKPVGFIDRLDGAEWKVSTTRPLSLNSEFFLGESMDLEKGQAGMTLFDASRIVLEGPASLELQAPGSIAMEHGVATFFMPLRTRDSYLIHLPDFRITSSGETNQLLSNLFTISFAPRAGRLEITVSNGEVKVDRIRDNRTMTLSAGQHLLWMRTGEARKGVAANPSSFASPLSPSLPASMHRACSVVPEPERQSSGSALLTVTSLFRELGPGEYTVLVESPVGLSVRNIIWKFHPKGEEKSDWKLRPESQGPSVEQAHYLAHFVQSRPVGPGIFHHVEAKLDIGPEARERLNSEAGPLQIRFHVFRDTGDGRREDYRGEWEPSLDTAAGLHLRDDGVGAVSRSGSRDVARPRVRWYVRDGSLYLINNRGVIIDVWRLIGENHMRCLTTHQPVLRRVASTF